MAEPLTPEEEAALRAAQPPPDLATLAHIRALASGEGGDEASRTDPHNALATIVLAHHAALALDAESETATSQGALDSLAGMLREADRAERDYADETDGDWADRFARRVLRREYERLAAEAGR